MKKYDITQPIKLKCGVHKLNSESNALVQVKCQNKGILIFSVHIFYKRLIRPITPIIDKPRLGITIPGRS